MSNLVVPPHVAAERLAEKHLKQAKNALLDLVYIHIRKGKSNRAIIKDLRKRNMPPIEPSQLNSIREWFKKFEAEHPEKVAGIRRRLGI